MRVLIVSGIWPPDAGGPASHAPEVCDFLAARGHAVEVVTTAAASPPAAPYPVRWVSRRLPQGLRHARVAALVAARARRADVVYSVGMEGRSSVGARLAGTPLVMRLPSDPAFERAHWRGLTQLTLDRFDEARGLQVGALRWARSREVASATRIVVPSAWLRELVLGWGVVSPETVEVLPHALSVPPPGEQKQFDGPTLVLAGRLVRQKALEVALQAVAQVQGVSLVVAGDGPERELLEAAAPERVRFLGAQPRDVVFELFRAADAALLSSAWESFGLVVAEALAVGTPVISTAVGGVVEVLEDGVNGLLVPPGDPDALAAAIRRFFGDEELRARLRAAAAPSVAHLAPEGIYSRLEEILAGASATT